MFGPNQIATYNGEYFTHRDAEFKAILRDLQQLFCEKFNLIDHVVLFVTGPGTLANEIVVNSCLWGMEAHYDGKFGKRLSNQIKERNIKHTRLVKSYVYYETSTSTLNQRPFGAIIFSDMISAFPYYSPDTIDIWTTVSCKQLGAMPVIGIIVIAKTMLNCFYEKSHYSILDLHNYLAYSKKDETPTTAAIPLYLDLLERLDAFHLATFRSKINHRRAMLERIIPRRYRVGSGPVFTVRNEFLAEDIIKKYSLYKGDGVHQIFLWSGTDKQYETFIKELK